MDKTVMAETVANEICAAGGCMIAAMNNLAGPYGKAYGRCVSDLYYASDHLGRAARFEGDQCQLSRGGVTVTRTALCQARGAAAGYRRQAQRADGQATCR